MRPHLSRCHSLVLALPVAVLASCTGTLGDPKPGHDSTPSGAAGSSGVVGGAGGGSVSPTDCSGVHPGPSRVRRLNRFEYNNTARDLLGDATRPADEFPAEERSHLGLDNDASALTVSPVLVEQYQAAAESLASAALTHLATLLPCDPAKDGEDACAKAFVSDFGAKAFRRPLAADETERLSKVMAQGRSVDFVTGVRLVIETVLQSAPFLYRVEFGAAAASAGTPARLTSWEMASRLSYLLWQSMPDAALTGAAQQDALLQDDAIAAQVTRMLSDPKARSMVAHFHDVWLHLENGGNIEKDAQIFATFTPEVAGLMSEETHRFLDYLVWDGEGDVGSMFTAPYSFMNGKLAAYYGVQGPSGDEFAKVQLEPTQRVGLLTQGAFLSRLAKANQTGPVQRGKFVREQFLCMEMPPPPAGVVIKVPDLSPTLSTRERFAAHSQDPTCKACHGLMDPIGLSLENFDGAGRYRLTENGKDIDVAGEITQSDVPGPFSGAAGLAQKLAASETVKGCVSKAWFQYAFGRAESAEDACTLSAVQQKFKSSGYKFKDLIVALTQTDAFRFRNSVAAGGAQ